MGARPGPLAGSLPKGKHEACPYVVIELRKVGSYKCRDYSSNADRSMGTHSLRSGQALPMRTGGTPVPRTR